MPPGAIPVIRWWQKHRQPGSQRFKDLVMPLLGKKELARNAEYTLSEVDTYWNECTEAEREQREEHLEEFKEHFRTIKIFESRFIFEAELEEIGVTAKSSNLETVEGWLVGTPYSRPRADDCSYADAL
jgi:hypothetical protein